MNDPAENEISIAVFIIQNWLNILFGVVGIVGTVLTIFSWRTSKKTASAYKHLFEIADKHIDKSLTEKNLSDIKKELEEKLKHTNELQRKIKEEIPIEARRAILRDKLERSIEHMHEAYSYLQKNRESLNRLGEKVEIPVEIEKAIIFEIQPEYLLKKRKTTIKNYLVVLTTIVAVSSAILPYEISRIFSLISLLIFGTPLLIVLIKISWKDIISTIKNDVIPFSIKNSFIIAVTLFILAIATFFIMNNLLYYEFDIYIDDDYKFFIPGFLIMLGIFSIFSKLASIINNKIKMG